MVEVISMISYSHLVCCRNTDEKVKVVMKERMEKLDVEDRGWRRRRGRKEMKLLARNRDQI